MFVPTLETILTALAAIQLNGVAAFKTVGPWQGDTKDLLDMVQKLPSAHVLLSVGDFDESNTIGGKTVPFALTWSVIVLTENLKDRATAARETLSLLQLLVNPAQPDTPDVSPGLTRLNTGYGPLWPVTVQLLGTDGGKTAYGFKFTHEKGRNQR